MCSGVKDFLNWMQFEFKHNSLSVRVWNIKKQLISLLSCLTNSKMLFSTCCLKGTKIILHWHNCAHILMAQHLVIFNYSQRKCKIKEEKNHYCIWRSQQKESLFSQALAGLFCQTHKYSEHHESLNRRRFWPSDLGETKHSWLTCSDDLHSWASVRYLTPKKG